MSIADNIHLVSDGRVVEQGTYDDIFKQENSKIRQLIEEFGKKKDSGTSTPTKEIKDEEDEEPKDNVDLANLDSDSDYEVGSLRRASDASLLAEDEVGLSDQEEDEDEESKARKEHLEQGQVKWEVYKEYANACNPVNVAIFLFTAFLCLSINVASNVWLKHWSEAVSYTHLDVYKRQTHSSTGWRRSYCTTRTSTSGSAAETKCSRQ